jgi:Ni,Fe-hydrogenase I large subunit
MSKRVTIDPITRIEGHVRIDVEVAGQSAEGRGLLDHVPAASSAFSSAATLSINSPRSTGPT